MLLLIFPFCLICAMMTDVLEMKISNRLNILIAGLYFGIFAWTPWGDLTASIISAGVVFAIGFLLFAAGWMGGGDVKLLSAGSLWLGIDASLDWLILTVMIGGALTLIFIQLRQWPLPGFISQQPWAQRLHDANSGIPYGIAIGLAGLWVWPKSQAFQHLVITYS